MKRPIVSIKALSRIAVNWVWLMGVCCCCLGTLVTSCNERVHPFPGAYHFIQPEYDSVNVQVTTDTIHFLLTDDMYNIVKSFNLFTKDGKQFIAFYDKRGESINIYDFDSKNLASRLDIKKLLSGRPLHKTSIYMASFDSIFIVNTNKLYLMDSTGEIKNRIQFLDRPKLEWAVLENEHPPIIKGNQLYTGVSPYVEETSLHALRQWKVMYSFNLITNKPSLHFSLPEIYQEKLYGYHLLDNSYCYNDKGNFVFSFPADTVIYESNLKDQNNAYYGKSHFQTAPIQPVEKKILKNMPESQKSYLTRDSYGSIYFDAKRKYYLRVVERKVREADYLTGKRDKGRSLLVFNSQFKIIGETEIGENISLSTLFFTREGDFYTRVNFTDEHALHFVKLAYKDKGEGQTHLTKN